MLRESTRSTRRIYGARPPQPGGATGLAAAVVGSLAYGITVVIGRDLAQAGFTPAIGLGIRFGIAAVVLFGIQAATRRPLLPAPGERIAAVLLGAIG